MKFDLLVLRPAAARCAVERSAWYSSRKVGILPLSLWLLERCRQKIFILPPFPHPSAKFCPNPSSFLRDISDNVFQTHYSIGVKPAGFSPRKRGGVRLTHFGVVNLINRGHRYDNCGKH